jgi:hypothetical protein
MRPKTDWLPFESRLEFELAEFLFQKTEMSASRIDELLELWAASQLQYTQSPPFSSYRTIQKKIDNIPVGDVPWTSFQARYTGNLPVPNPPKWMTR